MKVVETADWSVDEKADVMVGNSVAMWVELAD